MSTKGDSPEQKPFVELESKDRCPPIEDLLHNQGAMNAAVDALSTNLATLATQYRRYYRAYIADAYFLASVMRKNADTWRDFCRKPDWNDAPDRPKIDAPERALEYVLRIVCGLGSRTGRQKASKLKLALLDAWEAEISPAEIQEWLKQQGGIEKAYNARRARLAGIGSQPATAQEHSGEAIAPDEGDASFSTLQILASDEHIAKINKLGLSSFATLSVRRSDGDPSKFEIALVKKGGPYLRWIEPQQPVVAPKKVPTPTNMPTRTRH